MTSVGRADSGAETRAWRQAPGTVWWWPPHLAAHHWEKMLVSVGLPSQHVCEFTLKKQKPKTGTWGGHVGRPMERRWFTDSTQLQRRDGDQG